jgi:exosortase
MIVSLSAAIPVRKHGLPIWITGLLLPVTLIWSYWPTLAELWGFWQRNQDYSVGGLVPLAAAYLVWSDRKSLKELPARVCLWGLLGIGVAQVVRFVGLYYDYVSLERYSFVLTLASLCWLLFGSATLRRCGWVALLLLLMVPLPGRVHNAVTLPLQGFATRSAAFVLELFGYWVSIRGNVLDVNGQTPTAVAEACNGLRMLTAFVFVSAVLAFLVRRPGWQKGVVIFSSIPIAIVANTVRLVATVILFDSADSELADRFFHDFAGVVMMPIAIVLVLAELRLLKWCTADGREEAQSTTCYDVKHGLVDGPLGKCSSQVAKRPAMVKGAAAPSGAKARSRGAESHVA